MAKIKVTAEVRKLLSEQADLFQLFGEQTAELATPGIASTHAGHVGADREDTRSRIMGVAWRIHCAATGTKL